MVMNAIYTQKPNCSPCIDLGWYETTNCLECRESLKQEVSIVAIGAGVFHDKAVIKLKCGELKNVPLDELMIIDAT